MEIGLIFSWKIFLHWNYLRHLWLKTKKNVKKCLEKDNRVPELSWPSAKKKAFLRWSLDYYAISSTTQRKEKIQSTWSLGRSWLANSKQKENYTETEINLVFWGMCMSSLVSHAFKGVRVCTCGRTKGEGFLIFKLTLNYIRESYL